MLILFIIFPSSLLATVEARSQQITTSEGFSNNTVRYFYQDSKGFIWMATVNGLSRYDGTSFINFYPDKDNPVSLADHRVYDITEDKNGFLWISTSSELYSCYDLKYDRFVDYTGNGELYQNYAKQMFASNGDVWLWHDGNGARQVTYKDEKFSSVAFNTLYKNLPGNSVRFVYEDSRGIIWIGTSHGLVKSENGVSRIIEGDHDCHDIAEIDSRLFIVTNDHRIYSVEESGFSRLIYEGALPDTSVTISLGGTLVYDREWVIFTTDGVSVYNPEDKTVRMDSKLFGAGLRSGGTILDNKGNYWVYNHTGYVWYVNPSVLSIKKFQLIPEDRITFIDNERYHVIHDSRNIIWISTYGNGLFAYDIAADELQHFSSNINGFSHITSDFLQTVMEDRSGNIWVSSEYSGISKITVLNEGSYRLFPEDRSLLDRSNTIRMISALSEGDIWIGTSKGGLYRYDSKLNIKPTRYFFNSNIYALLKDQAGKMWLGTRGDGLSIENVWYKYDVTDPASLSNNNIFCLHEDRKRRIWVGTFGGGLDLTEQSEKGYSFKHYFNQTYGQRQVRVLTEDARGHIWMGTSDGIYIFDQDALIEDPRNFYTYNTADGALLSNEIRCIYKDSQNRMWLGTSGGGFSLCVKGTEEGAYTFKHYTVANGLVNNVVQSMVEDNNGNLWIATEYGISKFDPLTEVFENYFFSNYALGNVYTENCVCKCEDGRLLFGSNYGLVMIDPASIHKNSFLGKVVFTNLKINGIDMKPGNPESPLHQSVSYSDQIRLNYTQNSFIIDFSTFNYSDQQQTKYMYKLEPYDTQWSVPGSLNFAAYKNLPPGRYLLRVKGSDGSGVWSEEESQLKVVITPPWWATVWAFMIYTLLVFVAIWFAYKVMRNFTRLHNRIEVEKQLTEYKLVFFTNISHEFRTPLTLIQGALKRIRCVKDLPQEVITSLNSMNKSSKRMLRLIDQLLEFRKMQNNKLALSLEETDVIEFLYEIYLSFKDVAEQKNMDFRFQPSVTAYKMYIDKEKLDKVTYNLISNAFKYTPSRGRIVFSVSVDEEKNQLRIRVSDTGVGIPKEKRSELFKRFMQSSFSGESVGVGLHLSHELVNVHKGTIEYAENEGGGSVFLVSLPVDLSVYEEKDFLIHTDLLVQEEEKEVLQHEELQSTVEKMDKKSPPNQHKVLIIEDDIEVRQFLREEIGVYFQVEMAEDGLAGIEQAQNYDPDLIVCDVLMPRMNGYEVTRKLKTDFKTSHIPVILLTALSSPENHLEGIESGADAYIPKPFSVKLLLARIIKLIEQREKLREKFSSEPSVVRPAICSTDKDKEFIDKLHQILDKELVNPKFSVDEFASQMGLGRTVFYKKVRGVTGYSPNEYIRIIRMKRAAELLLSTNLTVAEVSYKVGINDPFYFSKCFKSQFGVAPSIYQKGITPAKE
ncbi:MAG: response regulator [Bacteroides sp.]|nr:response regulator [Bacteroides sp.]